MDPIRIMINGLPGNVAAAVARTAANDSRFRPVDRSLTGPEITADRFDTGAGTYRLVRPEERAGVVEAVAAQGPFISIDFTHPAAVNDNAAFYCRHGLPFVMGTTGGDRRQLEETVAAGDVPAVIAPNMAAPIVAFQAMMEYAGRQFPGMFAGYELQVRESHQQGKADTSGTAKAVVAAFNRLGVSFGSENIEKERDPRAQRERWGVPAEHLRGHGWHTYDLDAPDASVHLSFTHNVNGREVYVRGTLDAVCYLREKVAAGVGGRVYSMIDVLGGE